MKSYRKHLIPLLLFLWIILTPVSSGLAAGTTFDLDFKNADIQDVFRSLASQERVSIYVDNDVSGKVTISLNNVTFIEALTILTKNNNLTFTKSDNVYYIKPLEDPVLNVQYANGKLYLEAKRIKLSSVLETVSQKSGANLVPAPELQEKISIVVGPAPLEDAIQALLSQSNCIGEKNRRGHRSPEKNDRAVFLHRKLPRQTFNDRRPRHPITGVMPRHY